jgi:O-antigen ligase
MSIKQYPIIYNLYLICNCLTVCLIGIQDIWVIPFVALAASVMLLLFIVFFDADGLLLPLKATRLVCLFVFLISIGLLRSNLPGTSLTSSSIKILNLLVYYLNTIYIIYPLIIKNDIKRILNLIVLPFLILGTLNLVAYFLGFYKSTSASPSVMAGLIGLKTGRVKFLFAGGINSYATVNGFFLSISALCFYYKIYSRNFCCWCLIVFLGVAILCDSRAAVIFGAVSIFSGIFLHKKRKFFLLKIMPAIVVLGPILLVVVITQLASSGVLDVISRGDNDAATGNSRFILWILIGSDFLFGKSLTLFGLGEGGIYKTDSVDAISGIFEGFEGNAKTTTIMHPHSTLFGMLLDNGIITFVLYIVLLVILIKTLSDNWNYNSHLFVILSAMLIYLILTGITESFFGYYYQNLFVVYLFMFCLIFCVRNVSKANPKINLIPDVV